jgi:hypothetical protein
LITKGAEPNNCDTLDLAIKTQNQEIVEIIFKMVLEKYDNEAKIMNSIVDSKNINIGARTLRMIYFGIMYTFCYQK